MTTTFWYNGYIDANGIRCSNPNGFLLDKIVVGSIGVEQPGAIKYDTGLLKYYDGNSWVTLDIAGTTYFTAVNNVIEAIDQPVGSEFGFQCSSFVGHSTAPNLITFSTAVSNTTSYTFYPTADMQTGEFYDMNFGRNDNWTGTMGYVYSTNANSSYMYFGLKDNNIWVDGISILPNVTKIFHGVQVDTIAELTGGNGVSMTNGIKCSSYTARTAGDTLTFNNDTSGGATFNSFSDFKLAKSTMANNSRLSYQVGKTDNDCGKLTFYKGTNAGENKIELTLVDNSVSATNVSYSTTTVTVTNLPFNVITTATGEMASFAFNGSLPFNTPLSVFIGEYNIGGLEISYLMPNGNTGRCKLENTYGGNNSITLDTDATGTPTSATFSAERVYANALTLNNDDAVKPLTNTWTIGSDIAFKENITDLDKNKAVAMINDLTVKKFKYKALYNNTVQCYQLGFIAQDFEKVQAVHFNDVDKAVKKFTLKGNDNFPGDYKSLNKSMLTELLIANVQVLNEDNKKLKSTVDSLTDRIKKLEAQIIVLTNLVEKINNQL